MSTMTAAAREIEAAKLLRAQIEDICGNDPDFLRDAIEGETNLREIISTLAAEEGEDAAQIDAAKEFIGKVQGRIKRLEDRIEYRRTLMALGLQTAELKKLETPTGVVTLAPVAPKPIYQDEAEIPSRFWKTGEPKLDRKAVAEAMKAGEAVPGVVLSNGSFSIRIRR